MQQEIVEISTKTPSFISTLFQSEFNLLLIYAENSLDSLYDSEPNLKNMDCTSVSEHDLTGTPLETNLSENNDDIIPECAEGVEKPKSWSLVESKYYPIAVKIARERIQELLNAGFSRPIFCICDGKSQNIVLIGSEQTPKKLIRALSYILPCQIVDDHAKIVDKLRNEHLKLVRGKPEKNESLSVYNYYVYGYDLKNCLWLKNASINGSVSVNVVQNDPKSMHFQSIIGHSNSPLKRFWAELSELQEFTKIMISSTDHEGITPLRYDSKDVETIIEEIENEVDQSTCWVKENDEDLNLEKLRTWSILDKLWLVLKHCGSLSDLSACFMAFFEQLVEKNKMVCLSDTETSTFAKIVIDLSEGKIAVPTLNFSHCLGFLIDLGIQKLKEDYFTIITKMDNTSNKEIKEKWRNLCMNDSVVEESTGIRRKTRISLHPKAAANILMGNRLKLAFLVDLHTVCEFMLLYKNHVHDDDNFNNFYSLVMLKFVLEKCKPTLPNVDLVAAKLCELDMEIGATDIHLTSVLSSWTLKMNSTIRNSEVMSVYHFSLYPIFPPTIFKDYVLPEGGDANVYFASKLVQFTEFFKFL